VQDGSGRVTARGLGKRVGSRAVVDDLTFSAGPGSVTGLLGGPGAGKTTTLRMLLGLVRPTAGEARINGVPFGALEHPARVVGAVLQGQGFHPARPGRAQLRACAAAIGVADDRVDHLLQVVGLAEVAGHRVGRYPPGMRQRLALAAALLGDPQVLVLDEPGAGLDGQGAAWLHAFLRAYAAQGRTVLLSGRQPGGVETIADRVVVLHRGRCVHQGGVARGGVAQSPEPRSPRVLVECAAPVELAAALAAAGLAEIDLLAAGRLAVAGADVERVGDIARAAGVPLRGLGPEPPDPGRLRYGPASRAPR
jgi:ABC-2 type transport system ATP-binding protein